MSKVLAKAVYSVIEVVVFLATALIVGAIILVPAIKWIASFGLPFHYFLMTLIPIGIITVIIAAILVAVGMNLINKLIRNL